VAVSRDVMSAGHLLALALGFSMFGAALYDTMADHVRNTIYRVAGDSSRLWDTFAEGIWESAGPVLGIAFIGLLGLVFAGLGQTRFLFAWKLISFKASRINPVEKLKELFGPAKATVRVGLAVAKVTFTGIGILIVIDNAQQELTYISMTSVEHADAVSRKLLWQMLMVTVGSILFIAVLDYAWQRRQLMNKMRMTRDEAKRELEQSEGKPEFKARRRAMHRELTANRIIEAVPEADVVITNPTHLAVALRYRAGEDEAPVVTAKGADELAAIIRDIARKHAVPLVENKPIARELWRRVKVGNPIPKNLFVKVAEILARIYKAKREQA